MRKTIKYKKGGYNHVKNKTVYNLNRNSRINKSNNRSSRSNKSSKSNKDSKSNIKIN